MLPNPEDCHYQSCYCEENIWHLCQHPVCTESTVIFIASHGGMFPMLYQKAMSDPTTPILWDYHVILLLAGQPAHILDFDTILPFCTELGTYLPQSFLPEKSVAPEYRPYFRLIPAQAYLREFRSDRSHMRTEDGGWNSPPPDWPPIGNGGSNLARFIDMQDHSIGEVLSYNQLLNHI